MIIANSYPTRTRGIIVNYTENELDSDARRAGGGGAKYNSGRLMEMCRWMGSQFHDWIDYCGVAFL